MILITAATEDELKPLERFLAASDRVEVLITGMGPVTAAASLSSYLALHAAGISAVLNTGVAGAYIDSGVAMLDICLAQQEVLGDFGICMQDEILDFNSKLAKADHIFVFNSDLVVRFKNILTQQKIGFKFVNFVTVNCCTGYLKRGEFLRKKYKGACENMEGAAVAMVCENFNMPCIELRCVSNMVEDRDKTKWQLAEATEKACRVVEILVHAYIREGVLHGRS